jgi:hypothetical protein
MCGSELLVENGRLCRSPAMANARCRMHGGSRSPGGAKGNRNAFKHGRYTADAIARPAGEAIWIICCRDRRSWRMAIMPHGPVEDHITLFHRTLWSRQATFHRGP